MGDSIAIAEGVEDAIAAAELLGVDAWSALSATNMPTIELPNRTRNVTIVADRDENGVGERAAWALADRLEAEGRKVRVMRPSDGHKDANDVLKARRCWKAAS